MLFVVKQKAATCVFSYLVLFFTSPAENSFVASENTRVETFIIISQAEAYAKG